MSVFGKYLKIHIEDIPSSNNKYQGQGSKSKAIRDYQGEKKLWSQLIWIMKGKQKKRGDLDEWQLPLQKATIIMMYHFKGNGRRDPDNYSGKMILDGLRDWGYITDDSFKEIDILPLADFGHKSNSVDIYILEGKQMDRIIREYLEQYT